MRDEETRVTTVVLGIHHTLWRHGLRALLQEAGGHSVLADVGSAREVYLLAARHRPDIVLMDVDPIDHPTTTGEALASDAAGVVRQLASLGVTSKLLFLGSRASEAHLLSLIRAGAAGFMSTDATPTELICALHEVQHVGFYLSPSVSRKVLNRWHRTQRPLIGEPEPHGAGAGHGLSDREGEVLACVASGMQNREIARRLQISVKTVEAHKAKIVSRLGLRGASDLVRFAAQAAVRRQEDALGAEVLSSASG